jgi:hypothetical protein
MNVRREDLQAAAAAGVVQYKQIDQILIFLLQRDVLAQRSTMLAGQGPGAGVRHVLYYLLTLLAIIVLAAQTGLYARLAVEAHGVAALWWFAGAYVLLAVAVAAWFERRRASVAVRILATSAVALVPLAVFAAQRLVVLGSSH